MNSDNVGVFPFQWNSAIPIIELVKPKTKHYPTLTSDIYIYGEVLHIIADISNTKLKFLKRLKLRG